VSEQRWDSDCRWGSFTLQPDDDRLRLALKPAFDTFYHTWAVATVSVAARAGNSGR